jgi:hypothetical protein
MLDMQKALIQSLRGFAADLTRKRVRGHAILLGLVLWGAYAINITKPGLKDREGQLKGADFLHVYVLGNIARLHDASMLYDAPRQAALGSQLIHQDPGETYLPVYGPQYSLIFRPLAALPYGLAAAPRRTTPCFALPAFRTTSLKQSTGPTGTHTTKAN